MTFENIELCIDALDPNVDLIMEIPFKQAREELALARELMEAARNIRCIPTTVAKWTRFSKAFDAIERLEEKKP